MHLTRTHEADSFSYLYNGYCDIEFSEQPPSDLEVFCVLNAGNITGVAQTKGQKTVRVPMSGNLRYILAGRVHLDVYDRSNNALIYAADFDWVED